MHHWAFGEKDTQITINHLLLIVSAEAEFSGSIRGRVEIVNFSLGLELGGTVYIISIAIFCSKYTWIKATHLLSRHMHC